MAGIDWGALLEGMGKGYVTGTNLTIAQEELKLKKAEDKRKEDDANKKIFETMENIAREGTAEKPAISGEPAIQSVKDIKTFDMFRLGEIPSLSEFGQTPSTTVGPTIESAPSAPGLPSTLSRLGTPPYKPGKAPFLPAIQARPAVAAVEAQPATPLSVEQVQAKRRGEIEPGIEYKPKTGLQEIGVDVFAKQAWTEITPALEKEMTEWGIKPSVYSDKSYVPTSVFNKFITSKQAANKKTEQTEINMQKTIYKQSKDTEVVKRWAIDRATMGGLIPLTEQNLEKAKTFFKGVTGTHWTTETTKTTEKKRYTPAQEKTIQDNMTAYSKTREEVISALNERGLLK